MDQRVILKVTIPPEEILMTRLLICQVDECAEQFSNASHLQMHLTRHHRLNVGANIAPLAGVPPNDGHVRHFYCPVESCVYHLGASGEKFFTSFRYLKQHFLKVHSAKNFICNGCNGQKSFATESLLRAHQANCGQSFVCTVCGFGYGSREALLTHAKRKNHHYEELIASKRKAKPKPTGMAAKVIRIKREMKAKHCQTEKLPEPDSETIRISQTTQTEATSPEQAEKIECYTQTASSSQNLSESPSTSTVDNCCQTMLQEFNYFEPNSLIYFENTVLPVATASSSESVTCVCTETQTDQIYDEMFPNEDRSDPMLYSHMYTQTCDREDIFPDLALATIETQTTWGNEGLGELLVSTETQTNLNPGSSADGDEQRISSIQTQTSARSMEFLNAISLECNSIHTQTS